MISKVELYLNDNWQDATPYLQMNDVVRQNRCDDAFATGSLQLRYHLSTNIPPYTPLRINSNELWFAKSTCRKYLTMEGYYIHNIELLELTSILSCYVLGSKSFSATGSHKKDYEKLEIIVDLMKEKYGVSFVFPDCMILDKEQEFPFGPGTTIYDALLEIVKSYDSVKVKVVDYNPSKNEFIINFILDDSTYSLKDSGILDEYYTQDSDTYGAILESEMTNVIDRTNPIVVSSLTLRADEVHMSEDNSILFLPTRCEKVLDFWTELPQTFEGMINFDREKYSSIIDAAVSIGDVKTFRDWQAIIIYNGESPLDYFLPIIVNGFNIDSEIILNSFWRISRLNDNMPYALYTVNSSGKKGEIEFMVRLNLSNRILPKDKWMLLEDREKPKYVYYESGSNRIEGMNNYYKNDFWNSLIGNTVGPFLNQYNSIEEISEEYPGEYLTNLKATHYINFGTLNDNDHKSLDYSYWIEYIPIVDPFISDVKRESSFNENKIKRLARTYDKNSNFIDFDRMIDSIELTNDMAGLPECTIEYKLSKNEAPPQAFNRIKRNGIDWFVSSVITTSSLKKEVAVINLVANYNKVADAIGIKTQYNETKNPLNNIIDRPIYWEYDCSNIPGIPSSDCWIKVEACGRALYKRAAVMVRRSTVYVYAEALDQYSFDKCALKVGGTNNYQCNDVSYCDSNNEITELKISVGTIMSLTRNESLQLPNYFGNNYVEFLELPQKTIWKDSRERLIFTIKLTNCKTIPFESIAKVAMRRVLTISVDSGVASWVATRLSSEVKMPLGNLSQGAYLYEGDVVEVSASAKEGYALPEGNYVKFKVAKVNEQDEPLNIIFNSIEKFVGVPPEIIYAKLTQDSYSATWYFSYKIKNPNIIGGQIIVEVFIGEVLGYTFSHNINDDGEITGGFSDAPLVTSIRVKFVSPAVTGNLIATSSVTKVQ
ncbi:MAG: hypothetical protein NC087_04965 [Anaeroplasma bactoclasticum]|nr:hypothetical protein [Anaeroplasma bactoclasticum]